MKNNKLEMISWIVCSSCVAYYAPAMLPLVVLLVISFVICLIGEYSAKLEDEDEDE